MAVDASIIQFRDRSNDSSVYPITKQSAVLDASANQDLTTYITEYNISLHQVNKTANSPRYDTSIFTLEEAIAQVPAEYKHGGLKLTFNSSSSDTGTTFDHVSSYVLDKDSWNSGIGYWKEFDHNELSQLQQAYNGLATDTANLQTQADELKTVATLHEERIENAELMADDQWQNIDRIDQVVQTVAQQTIDHPEAEDLGHADDIDELDDTLSLALEPFCAQGIYASYVWNDAYNVRSRRYEVDPDTGLPIPTGERIIQAAMATVGDTNKQATIWVVYSLYDFYHDGGMPAPNSRLQRPVYVATAIRLFDQQLSIGSAPRLGWGDEQPAAWTWRPATRQDDMLTQIEALREAIDVLDSTRRYISDCTSYVSIEQAILDDIHNAENTVREWLADFPQNGGTDTWHYQLLSIDSTGLAKVLRTNSAGIFLLSAAKTATKFTDTQKLAF